MAQLKDLIVNGATRLVGNAYASILQLTTLKAPTTSGGSTYGTGTNGQVLKSNGSSVCWNPVTIPRANVGDSSTATAFVATIDGITELVDGVCCILANTKVKSASGCTLNVNGLGAKPIYRPDVAGSAVTTHWALNVTNMFVYNTARVSTGCWDMYYMTDNNTTYSNVSLGQGYATCATAEATVAKVGTLSSYALTTGGIVAVKFTYAVPASATLNINSKGAKAMYYKGAAIAAGIIQAGDLATFMYNGSQYHLLAIDREAADSYTKSEIDTDDYGHFVYKLHAPRTLDGSSYLDTGIKLYEDVTSNWTFVCRYSGEVRCNDGYPVNIFCCLHDGTNDGIMLRYTGAESPMAVLGSGGMPIGSAYNNNTSINFDGTNVIIIVKSGDNYKFFCNNTICAYGSALAYGLTSDKAHSLSLIFGARWSSSGDSTQYKTSLTLEDARVYDFAMTDSDAVRLYNEELITASYSKSEIDTMVGDVESALAALRGVSS